MKTCNRCHTEQKNTEYYKNHANKDGLANTCKTCDKEKSKINHQKRLASGYYKTDKFKNGRKAYKKRVRKSNNDKQFIKYHSDLHFRMKVILRTRVREVLVYKYKSDKTLNLLGCTVEEFIQHIENLFQDGMSWENYGLYGWHIDHIKPCALFDLSKEEEQKECFNYKNLQPLWAEDNLSKGACFSE